MPVTLSILLEPIGDPLPAFPDAGILYAALLVPGAPLGSLRRGTIQDVGLKKMKPPNVTMSANAVAATTAVPGVNRRRARRSRDPQLRSGPRGHRSLAATASIAAHAAQYSLNHSHGPRDGPKPLTTE